MNKEAETTQLEAVYEAIGDMKNYEDIPINGDDLYQLFGWLLGKNDKPGWLIEEKTITYRYKVKVIE